ncbi:MAG: dihydrodipicolinate synthase family protein [Planctomycetota bacterium]|jgi:4-hydroxy-tetrahydrodipicolinate synthase|nr:dihydrodipicolinate synthase family protein [Planctomycetota bacterium]
MQKKCFGIIPPIVTPIDENERVVESELRAMVEHCIKAGMHGIFVAGSNGEGMSLIQSERDRAVKITLDQCGDRLPVFAGAMDTSTRRVIENVKRLEQMGGRCAVVTPEFYARHATPKETIRHFEAIARNTKIDIVIYNIPLFTNCTLRAESIFKIAEIDNVVAYKDSASMVGETIKCINHFKNTPFAVLQGMVNLSAVSMLLGADGFVPSIGPLFPKACLKVYEHGRKGDIEGTMYWNAIMTEAQEICNLGKNATTSMKYAISLLGLTNDRMTLPFEPLTAEEKDEIRSRTRQMMEFLEKDDDPTPKS